MLSELCIRFRGRRYVTVPEQVGKGPGCVNVGGPLWTGPRLGRNENFGIFAPLQGSCLSDVKMDVKVEAILATFIRRQRC